MTNVLEGNVYNTVCKSADTQGATVRNLEVRFDKLTRDYNGSVLTNMSFTKIIQNSNRSVGLAVYTGQKLRHRLTTVCTQAYNQFY
jgi:hypothetical protein